MEHKPIHKHKLELKEITKENSGLFTKINCPSCEEEVPATNLQLNDKIGKCVNCNVVFPFHEAVSEFLNKETIKQEVIRPEGIDIFHFQEELDITIQQPMVGFDAFMGVMAAVFFLVLEIYFLTGSFSFYWVIAFSLFPLYFIYTYLNRAKNKINLIVDDKHLSIKWRPRKFVKDKVYDIHDIDQIYVNKTNGVSMIINGQDGQQHVQLLHPLSTPSKAKYLEQEIEKHLGITDRNVLEAQS